MRVVAEQLTVALLAENVGVGIDALFVEHIDVKQVIADLVGGVAEHEGYFLCALGDASQTDGKAVAAEDGEDDADVSRRKLLAHVLCDVVHACVVALRPCENGLGNAQNVLFADGDTLLLDAVAKAVAHDLRKVVALSDDGRSHASDNGSDCSFHLLLLVRR